MIRKSTDYIIVHCSATPPSLDWGAADIRRLHMKDPFAFSDIGYHYVIKRDGTVEKGRAEDQQGAHAAGWNQAAIGVCMVGGVNGRQQTEDNFTDAQYEALEKLLTELAQRYPKAVVCGHRDLAGVNKACPSFDVKLWCSVHLITHNWPDAKKLINGRIPKPAK